MADHDAAAARRAKVARSLADKVTDRMLTTPVKELSDIDAAILAAAFRGPHADEIVARIDAINAGSDGAVPQ